jgi:hypothetical protein
MHRREHKNKHNEAVIEEACKVVRNANEWETTLPEVIERAQSKRSEIRLASLQSYNHILSNKFIGPDLAELGDQIFETLVEPITSPVSKEEHDEALFALCNLALNQYRDMERNCIALLDRIMPTIAETPTERNFRFCALAFASGFTIPCNEKCEALLSRYLELIINKKKRTIEFEQETIAEMIKAVALMISILPSTVCIGPIGEQIQEAMDITLESQNAEILTAALDTLPVIYECIDEAESAANPEEEEESAGAKHFINRYKNKIVNLAEKVEKKSDQRAIETKVQSVLEFFETGEMVETMTLNEQEVQFDEARKITIIDAIKKVTRQHFSNMVSQNTGIHDALGFSLKATRIVLRKRRRTKKQAARERNESTKERQLQLEKDRKLKEKQLMGENHH